MPEHSAAERRPDPSAACAGSLVPFPAARRRADIRQRAGELKNLHGEAARLYWRQVCRELADELLQRGCSETDMRLQVLSFQDEVQAELMRRHDEASAGDETARG